MVQPADQMSAAVPYPLPSHTSGALTIHHKRITPWPIAATPGTHSQLGFWIAWPRSQDEGLTRSHC
jgi:hypothetical protein